MAEVFMQHRAELVFESEEEEAFIDRFMAWNKADNIGRKAVFYQGRREAEPYIDALTEEEKQELLDHAKKEYRSIDPDENVPLSVTMASNINVSSKAESWIPDK